LLQIISKSKQGGAAIPADVIIKTYPVKAGQTRPNPVKAGQKPGLVRLLTGSGPGL